MRARDAGRLGWALDPGRDRRPSVRGVEERQLVRPVAEDGNAERLQELHGRRDVEERLRPRADDERLGAGELAEVARDVDSVAAVHAADSAGAQEADAGRPAGRECSADRRRADGALDDAGGQVTWSDLPRLGGEPLELLRRQPDADGAVQHPDGCREGARLADSLLRLERNLDSLAGWESVRHERRLERDDRLAPFERACDFPGDLDHGIAPSFATHRAAASAASSGPPTR